MSNELTDVRCPCGAEFQADSYDAGFIAGSGMCQNCDAALPPKDICTCPSGDGSLRHPCPAHPAVEQAGGDERDFQAEGAQEVPSPVSQEYDRHLISLLRKGEALPGHQEEAADEIERLRDWNDHLNNTVLPNILNPNFLMLMKGGERLLDLCTKDGEFIGVSLNDMKDVFDWMVTHARIAPDQAALAQPSPAQTQPSPAPTLRAAIDVANDRFEVPVAKWGTDLVGEEERPEVAEVAFVLRNIGAMDAEDIDGDNVDLRFEDAEGRDTGCDVSIVEYAEKAADLFEQHDRIVGALRAEIAEWQEAAGRGRSDVVAYIAERAKLLEGRDAALARVAELDKQCRDDVARALGLRPSQERGFAWSYLLASIKSCVKASEDAAQAQHSVPEGWMLVPVEPTQAQLSAGQTAWLADPMRRSTTLYRAMLAAAPQPVTEGE